MNKIKLRKIIIMIVIIVAVLGYDISPVDIIPDIVAGVGQVDDIIATVLGVIGVVLNWVSGKKQNYDNADFREL